MLSCDRSGETNEKNSNGSLALLVIAKIYIYIQSDFIITSSLDGISRK
jgi:hypothetical protein